MTDRRARADTAAIASIYLLSAETTKRTGVRMSVDHIVPLTGKRLGAQVVCGLHCEANLQIIPLTANKSKNCHYWPDSP